MFEIYPDQYQELLAKKVKQLKSLFSDLSIPEVEVFNSPVKHFRMRAEFRIWHSDDSIQYVMFENKKPVVQHAFPQAHQSIANLMQPLLKQIEAIPVLRTRLFQIDYMCNLAGQCLVTLIYHKKLDEQWKQAALVLKNQFNIFLIGRSRKQKEILDQDFIIETLQVNNKHFQYQQIENSFTQPNAIVCQKMLEWTVNNTSYQQGDLLELYCGNGNFTLALAQNFSKILATEVSKTSVKSANFNIQLNQINNVRIARLSAEEISQALAGEREFRRLADISLENYNFNTLFVDPPRSGLDLATIELAREFEHIIYISCNPHKLVENIKQLNNINIEKIALFDQFPYTDHIECGVILRR